MVMLLMCSFCFFLISGRDFPRSVTVYTVEVMFDDTEFSSSSSFSMNSFGSYFLESMVISSLMLSSFFGFARLGIVFNSSELVNVDDDSD